ncbi:MAG: PAAR domain-containing protein [Pyrinomonadaceae bacterium]
MGGKPAARITNNVAHPLPGILTPGPGCPTVLIGYLPAWRGVSAGAIAGLQVAKQASEIRIKTAEAASLAAAPTPGAAAAKAAEQTLKAAEATAMGSMVSGAAGGADIHACLTLLPVPPHGPGVVITPSNTVIIGGIGAARMGDTILEAVGPPDTIIKGEMTVLIGD